MKKLLKKYPLLLCIVLLAFCLRLYKITTPLLDWHSWRQADTASVTREYTKKALNPLYPTYHDISDIPSGKNNPNGYRMVEFPIYNILVAGLLRLIPALPLVETSRIVSSLFSLGTLISIFFLTKSFYGKKAAYLAAFFFATIPYSVYYSRVILPEPIFVFFSTLSLATFAYYIKKPNLILYVTSLLSLMAALLLKPFVVFLAPVYITIVLQERGLKKGLMDVRLYIYALLSLVPFILWRKWIAQFPEGIPASDWLLNGNGIRFRPAWVRWLAYERITKLILGYTGVIFLPISFIQQLVKKQFLIPSWWLSIAIYFTVIATGNVHHDYYQVLITPIIAITLAQAVLLVDTFLSKKYNALVSLITLSTLIISMFVFSYQQVKGYYNINHPEYEIAGKAADRILPADAKVIAPQYGGDTAYLFQINRSGWPIGFSIDKKIELGATHYVTTNYDDEAHELEKKYHIVEKTNDYLILDLTNPREN